MTGAQKRQYVNSFCMSLHRRLVALYERLLPDYRKRHPGERGPCGSCAFRVKPSAKWKGRDSTMYGITRGLRGEALFVCHRQKMTGGNYTPHARPRFCAGFLVVVGHPEAERAIHEAAIDAAQGEA